MILAEIATDIPAPVAIGSWLVVLGFVLTILHKLRSWEKQIRGDGEKREISPQPLEVIAAQRWARAEEHEDLKRRVDQLESKMVAQHHVLLNAGEDRAQEIHRRIDGIPGQVIALLRDTKGLLGARRTME